jgi:predicted metal-dependent phosphoesterase TrpH
MRVDCHVHTVASGDSVLRVEQLARRATELGLDVVFVTDHNETAAALAARGRDLGVRMEVGEEIRTAAGEVLGLFLTERIPYVLPIREVVRRIRDQGGLVGLPHPFDPLRAGAGAVADQLCAEGLVDFVEVFNAKVHDPAHNAAAARLAQRHGLPGTAGSDAHDVAGLGAAHLEMPGFSSPEEFRTGLGAADVVGELRPHAPRFLPRAIG